MKKHKKYEESWGSMKKVECRWKSWGKLRKLEQCDWIAVWYKCIKLEPTPNATGEKSIEKFGASGISESCWSSKNLWAHFTVCQSTLSIRLSQDKFKPSSSDTKSSPLDPLMLYLNYKFSWLTHKICWLVCPQISVGVLGMNDETCEEPQVCVSVPLLPLSAVLQEFPNYSSLTNQPTTSLVNKTFCPFDQPLYWQYWSHWQNRQLSSRGETLTNPTDSRMNSLHPVRPKNLSQKFLRMPFHDPNQYGRWGVGNQSFLAKYKNPNI